MEYLKRQAKMKGQPTDEQWRGLYAAANAFKAAECWAWMEDGDIFAVQDPLDKQNYFCSIMGGGGMEFGVVAYRGFEGFKFLHQLLTVENEAESMAFADDIAFIQDALSCTFDDRDNLEKKDLEVIRRLGLKYRGRNEWPCFRDYTPGMVPWILTGAQCVTLTHILEQALAVALECKQAGTTDILFGPKDELMLRTVRNTKDGPVWSGSFMQEKANYGEVAELMLADQIQVQMLKKLPALKRKSWELDRFFLPTPIHDQERPYFPQMLAIADHDDGMALIAELVETNAPAELMADALINVVLKAGGKPRRVLVKQEQLAILLGKLCEQIGIELQLAKRLPRIAEMRQGFLEFSRSR